MHVVMFSINRAFHKAMEVGLRLTAEFGLTPSRYNLLYALHCEGRSLRQLLLRRMLGVSAPNVSRMVTSLEKLGLVARRRDAHGRSCGVELTEVGRERIEKAADWLVLKGKARAAVRKFFPPWPDGSSKTAQKKATRRAVLRFAWALHEVRSALGDRALFTYDFRDQKKQPSRVRYWGSGEPWVSHVPT
jgi:DNA-binding MarR family transcriptional regulator